LFPDWYRDKIRPLSLLFYNIFLLLYKLGIRIAARWNNKAALWLRGRNDIYKNLQSATAGEKTIWMHCASLGEFEQGRPVIEKIKYQIPESTIILTFFSPSGFEVRKNYPGASQISYLPMDSGKNAKKFLDTIRPSLVIFVKYDYWYYYLNECRKRKIPLLMISAVFRKDQPFFKWYGSLHRKMLNCFTHFFVQDEVSKKLLFTLKLTNVTLAGDTRFDRVAEIAEKNEPVPLVEKFCGSSQVLVAGSTWTADEKIIETAVKDMNRLKVIIAPHEIHREHLEQIKLLLPDSVFYSQLAIHDPQLANHRFLIIDNIGMLSRLYYYATVTYVGGGFDKGIHNTLEAAVYGKPVIFGPRYKKFREAHELIAKKAGFVIHNSDELKNGLINLLSNTDNCYSAAVSGAGKYSKENKGATEKIIRYIQENRLLTS